MPPLHDNKIIESIRKDILELFCYSDHGVIDCTTEAEMKLEDILFSALSRQRKEILDSLEEGLGEKKTNCGCEPFNIKHDGACKDGDYTDYNSFHSHMKEEIKKLR